jgi:hypothetical protein
VREATVAAPWCPRCLRAVGDAPTCPGCGLPQLGPEVARLRVLVRRLYDLGEERRALDAEAATLEPERRRLLEAVAGSPAAGSRPRPEWRPAVVRGLLLGLGSVLVALAALIFAAVTWVRLDDLGRAGLLAGATLTAWAAAAAARRRLPATGEALGGLALALLLVDWYALHRAGVGDGLPLPAWWALGSATAAAVAAAAGRWLAPGRRDAGRRRGRPGPRGRAHAARRQPAGRRPGRRRRPRHGPVAVVLAPALTRAALPTRSALARHALVAASAGSLLAAAGTLLASAWTSWSLAAAIAVLGAAAPPSPRVCSASPTRSCGP